MSNIFSIKLFFVRRQLFFFSFLLLRAFPGHGQDGALSGTITSSGLPLPYAHVLLEGEDTGTAADSSGNFLINGITPGQHLIKVSAVGFRPATKHLRISADKKNHVHIDLQPEDLQMNEVVVTGTLTEVNRLETPVPTEVYSPGFFKKNPTPSLFDAVQQINGVRPQLNCNICNTGDIHINGLEGPYTMVLIDGMPIVSGLSTVYGLSGIPNAMVERIEVVKGPASSLYGSEAVGGLINVITKNPSGAPLFSADVMGSTWQEFNADFGHKFSLGNKASVLTGLSYFNYSHPIDNNRDGFTDLTLQDRVSMFQKWNFTRNKNRLLSLAARYLYEDRWGGELAWTPEHRGGNEVYGEKIYTDRWEIIGNYQLPFEEKLLLALSYNEHRQDSYYGDLAYLAEQKIGFSQLTWDKALERNNLLLGTAVRYTYYDDNSPATASPEDPAHNRPDKTWIPGVFVQNELAIKERQKLLLGLRYDHHPEHHSIWTPRIAYKIDLNDKNLLRLNAGTGFRVVNLFTEEHAALTGAREVLVTESLDPERSYNVNLNYIKKIFLRNGGFLGLDASAWHTYFTNQILPDYLADPNKIIYNNLSGHAVTQGIFLNVDLELPNGLELLAGGTFMDVHAVSRNDDGTQSKQRPVLTEKWMGTWAVSFPWRSLNLKMDYTGNLYGPMLLPRLGALDPRSGTSPWWSLQNVQLTWRKDESRWEVYGGIKNLLNYTPPANSIARSHDPFDKRVVFDVEGNVVPTPDNPYGLTFDPTYVFAPNQGIRGFLGLRYTVRK